MNYFDILPREILFIIISKLNDRNQINKLIRSSEYLITLFNNDGVWKEMLYINIKDPIINNEYLEMDNYLNNLNTNTKYDVDIINLEGKFKYAIMFRQIHGSDQDIKNEIARINY